MASVETELTLQVDEEAVVVFLDEHGGLLLREHDNPSTYWAVMHPRQAREETFYARLVWSVYPGAPPSVAFADGIGGATSISGAWPNIPGYRIGSWDICMPLSAEGFAIHPDWQTGATAWRSTGNPFLWVVQTLQYDLDNRYQGRHP
jgi:hypothetical protein